MFRKKKRSNIHHDRETTQISNLELQPRELLYLILSYVDQATLYRSLSLVNVCFNKISRNIAEKKNDSLNDILQTLFHQLYQQFIKPSDLSPNYSNNNKHLIKQATVLKKRLLPFYSEREIHDCDDMWFHEKVSALNELICERLLYDVNAIERKHRFFKLPYSASELNPKSKKQYSIQKKELHTRTNFIVLNWLLKFTATRNTSGALFCLQHELESGQQFNDSPIYRQLLEATRDSIINAIPKDQLVNYFPSLQMNEFEKSLDYILWSNEVTQTVFVRVADDTRVQKIVNRTLSTLVSTFTKLHSLLEEKRQENLPCLRPT